MDTLALIVLVAAAVPALLFLLNLTVYRRLPAGLECRPNEGRSGSGLPCDVSVLIPARDEEKNIAAALQAILAEKDEALEVIVLDDDSTDETLRIAEGFARQDPRVHVIRGTGPPEGWCGKQYACQVLARHASGSLLMFLDADVALEQGAVARISEFMRHSRLDLASGIPRQETSTFLERLLIPLIHFVLLGYLPMHGMRYTNRPSMSAGCGQLFVARREAYRRSGGHAMLRDSLHDGIQLPRVFRRSGFRTGLFDATDLARCRMYHGNADVWAGLGKNSSEGLGAPGVILPMSVLLLVGQVLPLPLLAVSIAMDGGTIMPAAASAVVLSFLPRAVSAFRFRQDWVGYLLHPLGVLALVFIQWQGWWRARFGKPSSWKGRQYHPAGRLASHASTSGQILT